MEKLVNLINTVEAEKKKIEYLERSVAHTVKVDNDIIITHNGYPGQSVIDFLSAEEHALLAELLLSFAKNRKQAIEPELNKLNIISELLN